MINPYFLASKIDIVRIIFGTLVAIAESLANPAATIVIGLIFKDVQKVLSGKISSEELMQDVQKYVYGLVGVAGYSVICGSLGYWLWMNLGYSLGHKARSRLYKAMVEQPSEWIDENSDSGGIAMMRLKDIQDLETATGIVSFEIISMFVGCIVEVAVAFYFSWAVTLICLAEIPLLVIISSLFSSPIARQIESSKVILDIASKRVSWVFSALQTVKILQREKHEQRTINKTLSELKRTNVKYRLLFGIQEGICRAFVLMIFMQGFYFGSFMVRKHGLNAGNVITVFWSCLNASALLQSLISHWLEWNKGKVAAMRLAKAIKYDKEAALYNSIGLAPNIFQNTHLEDLGWQIDNPIISDWSKTHEKVYSSPGRSSSGSSSISKTTPETLVPQSDAHICFSDVIFSYPSRPDILFSELNMEFRSGETIFILGHSGSGKSSIGSLLTKQYSCQGGEINIGGHDVHLLSKLWIERNVYVCEQNPKLFDISVKDNIKIGSFVPSQVSDSDVFAALTDSCAEFVYDLPEGLETVGLENLSGGQKQRIALARARIRNAPIMIYDEVTSALDPGLQSQIYHNILSYRQGMTTIIITHDLSVIPKEYPVYVISAGKAEYFESMAQLAESDTFHNSVLTLLNAHVHEESSPRDAEASGYSKSLTSQSKPNDNAKKLSQASELQLNFKLFKSIPQKALCILGLVVCSLHAAVNPVFSYIFSRLLMGILDPDATQITMWAMLVLMCAFVDGILSFCKVLLGISAEAWLKKMRLSLFTDVLGYQGPQLSTKQVSYYTKLILSDSEKIAEVIVQYWPAMLSMAILTITGFVWSLAIEWRLTLVGISLLPAFFTCNQLFKYLTTRWTALREQKRERVSRLLLDLTSYAGFRTLKLQHLELYFKKFYLEREADVEKLSALMNFQVGLGYGVLKCFPYALESLMLWYGMKILAGGSSTTQNVMSVFSLLMFTVVTIDQLTVSIANVGTGFEALARLAIASYDFKVSTTDDETKEYPSQGIEGLDWKSIRFHHVGVEYRGIKTGLSDFSLFISAGETIALIGPSGVGKSTIARLLERLEKPSRGEIIVDEQWDLQYLNVFDVRKNVGLVEQAPTNFFDGTIKENLLYGLQPYEKVDMEKVIDICQRCGAHEFIEQLRDQYDTHIHSGLLSGGQMQRLAIARAIIRDPKILILDECTSALDVDSKEKIKTMLVEIKQTHRMIIVIITHQMDVARIADRVISL